MPEKEQARLVIRVQPNASQSRITGFKEGVLHVRIAAPPVEGKANETLVKFLSKQLDVSKSSLNIERGQSGRTKTIAVSGLSQSQLMNRLEGLTPSA